MSFITCTHLQYYDKIKEDGKEGAYNMHGWDDKYITNFGSKHKGKRPLG
jgi:hypothetical protein